jgi:predicted protein tyrosine phosphatase
VSHIYVCPLSKVEEIVRVRGARTLVTLLDRGFASPRPAAIEPRRHLIVSISDIVEQLEGHVLPQDHHVADLLNFVSEWDRRAPLLVHCFAGVSRSTAAAFIAACALEPGVPETWFAQAIRRQSATATPNARLVALADARLGRQGRMISAISAIGGGVPCYEAESFSFALRPEESSGIPDERP